MINWEGGGGGEMSNLGSWITSQNFMCPYLLSYYSLIVQVAHTKLCNTLMSYINPTNACGLISGMESGGWGSGCPPPPPPCPSGFSVCTTNLPMHCSIRSAYLREKFVKQVYTNLMINLVCLITYSWDEELIDLAQTWTPKENSTFNNENVHL